MIQKNEKGTQCSLDDCNRPLYAKGYCNSHYQRVKDGRDLSAPIRPNRKNGELLLRDASGNKFCTVCTKWVPISRFSAHGKTLDKLQTVCNDCTSLKRTVNNYGLTAIDIIAMLEAQGGCAICGAKEPTRNQGWHVDHDHRCCSGVKTCGKCVRGVLCAGCNQGLGQFEDDPKRLLSAIAYLA